MLKLVSRNRSVPRPEIPYSLCADLPLDEGAEALDDPQVQLDLVCRTLKDLGQLKRVVEGLPEVPLNNREDLLAQLASTSDSLRALYFLDAIY